MPFQVIPQRDFSKGLVAVTQELAQPKGTIPRVSNMLYTRRGGLCSCDGSAVIAVPDPVFWTGDTTGAFLDATWFTPAGGAGELYALRELIGTPEHTILLSSIITTYTDFDILATFPASSVINGTSINFTPPRTSSGGVVGECSCKPQLLSFGNELIIMLGNGVTPYAYPVGGPAVALANNFTGGFPTWTAATAYYLGAIINASPANGHLYKAIQSGTSGAGAPTFPTGGGLTVSDGASLIWQEAGSNSIVAPRGAAHGIIHAGFLWLWNTYPTNTADLLDGPSLLAMSDLNNPNSWNPLNRAYVDKDDGTEGTGLASFAVTGTGIAPTLILTLFKSYSTYTVQGVFGSSEFNIVRARTDLGCIAPRTIQFISGLGVMRLTHRGFALFDGLMDRVVSDEIRPYLFSEVPDITSASRAYAVYADSALVNSPPMYIASMNLEGASIPGQQGASSPGQRRLFCWDLISHAWAVIDLPFNIIAESRLQGSFGGQLGLMTALLGFGDGTIRRWQWKDATWDTGGGIAWSFQSPETYPSDPTMRTFYRQVLVRGQVVSGSTTVNAVATVNGTGQPQVIAQQYKLGSGRFELRVPIGLTGLSANLKLSGTAMAQVEIDSLEWHVLPKVAGVPASVMV